MDMKSGVDYTPVIAQCPQCRNNESGRDHCGLSGFVGWYFMSDTWQNWVTCQRQTSEASKSFDTGAAEYEIRLSFDCSRLKFYIFHMRSCDIRADADAKDLFDGRWDRGALWLFGKIAPLWFFFLIYLQFLVSVQCSLLSLLFYKSKLKVRGHVITQTVQHVSQWRSTACNMHSQNARNAVLGGRPTAFVSVIQILKNFWLIFSVFISPFSKNDCDNHHKYLIIV